MKLLHCLSRSIELGLLTLFCFLLCLADNVGDNVGDIAGMGADLFGSFAESTCAALIISAVSSLGTNHDFVGMTFPLMIRCAWRHRRMEP